MDYVAGFFDGEGCVCITKTHRKIRDTHEYVLSTGIGNTYAPILYYLKEEFGGYIHLNLSAKKRKATYKPFFQWHITGKKARCFLEKLLPYLIVKKEQAEIGIAFQKCKSTLPRRGQKTDYVRMTKFDNFRLQLAYSRSSDNLQYTEAISREDLSNQEPSTTTRGAAIACG